MLCEALRDRIQAWLRDYDRLQYFAVILLYIQVPSFAFLFLMIVNSHSQSHYQILIRRVYVQIACALLGSLGALYNGVLLINLAIALFALVAIESSSQSLGRTYAVLLVCAIFLDVSWFILFCHEIWSVQDRVSSSSSSFIYLILCLILCAGFFLPGPIQLSISFQ